MCRTQRVLALIALFVGLARSWDIVITKENILEFYTNDTVSASFIFADSFKLKSIVYNEVADMVVYVDEQYNGDRICGYYIAVNEYICFTEPTRRDIQGLAFDPATELLFFTDTYERGIYWISLKSGSNNNIYGNLLIQTGDAIPTDIAVDSCRGYVYWININETISTIERSHFDGSEREEYFRQDGALHSLVIDQVTQKMYGMWLPGENRDHVIWYTGLSLADNITAIYNVKYPYTLPPTTTLAVSKTFLYSADWCTYNCISGYAWKFPKTSTDSTDYKYIWFSANTFLNGITTNYNIKDNYQDLSDCEPLTKYVQNNVGPSCLYGQAICKCTPGYTGERCDVPV